MTYELTLQINDDSPAGKLIEDTAQTEHISREEAVFKLIERARNKTAVKPDAFSILGAGRDDAELIDEIMEIVMSDRQKHNAEPPRVS